MAKRTAQKILWETERLSDPEMRSRLATHALRSQSRRAIEAMVALAQSNPRIAIDVIDLDSDPWLLNVLNGTVNLRTGDHQKHRRSDLITKAAPVQYNPDAACPLWLRFLERVQPDPEIRSFKPISRSLFNVNIAPTLI
jgi:putative DNA primase/helicase